MSSSKGSSSARAPESGTKDQTNRTGLGPGGQHNKGSSGRSSRFDNVPESGTKSGSETGDSGSSSNNRKKR